MDGEVICIWMLIRYPPLNENAVSHELTPNKKSSLGREWKVFIFPLEVGEMLSFTHSYCQVYFWGLRFLQGLYIDLCETMV